MKNREIVIRKLEQIESNMNKLNFHVKQNRPIEDFIDTIDATKELVDSCKSFISQEPLEGSELNRI